MNKKTNQAGLSRRSFLKSAALASAAVAGSAALAGCSQAAGSSDQAAWLPAQWDRECDVLVIGYGGAGMWASLIAKDEGNAEVLVLEKAPIEGGGNSRINNGEWTVVADPERFKAYCKAFSHDLMDENMVDAYVEEATKHMDYADKYGMSYEVAEQALAGTIPEYYFLDNDAYAGCIKISSVEGFGMQTYQELNAAREELGIEVVFDCHDERLIQNPETKEIVGCYVKVGGEEQAFKARKGVIMTCGGFEFNEDLHKEYLKCYPWHFEGWRYNTGDGIKMVEEVGAKLWHMSMAISMSSMYTRDPENDFGVDAMPPTNSYFMVNRVGKRFLSESSTGETPHNGWHVYAHFDDTIDDYDRIPTWVVFDETCFSSGKIGVSQGDFFECGNMTSQLPDELRDWNGWSKDNQAEVEKGWITKADTIEELAKKMQEWDHWMDADTLKATFDEYQALCEAGVDPKFDRDPETLEKLDGGPYYCYTLYPGSCSTLGGPMKNENGQVLDVRGEVIPRLYSAGSFGNIQAHSYGITGGNNSENMVWGRIGGRHCASLEPWDAKN